MVLCHKDDEKEVDLRERGSFLSRLRKRGAYNLDCLRYVELQRDDVQGPRCHGSSRTGCFKETQA